MIQITPHMRILVAVEPIDFRAGIDGLVGACRKRLQPDQWRTVRFGNRARTAIKILVGDGQGFGRPKVAVEWFAFCPDCAIPTGRWRPVSSCC
jgi:hypothetical protein